MDAIRALPATGSNESSGYLHLIFKADVSIDRILSATNNRGISYAGNIPFIGTPANYYAVTRGMNWKPAKRLKVDWKPMRKLNVRPNICYDRADGIGMAFRPFDGRKDQFLFALDATIPF